jgi:hypothetical protein
MSPNEDEAGGRPSPTEPDPSRGVEQDPQGMTFIVHAPSWIRPPARGLRVSTKEIRSPGVRWDRWDIPELRLYPPASLLVLQGMSPQKLFDTASALLRVGDGRLFAGPFLYLRGKYNPADTTSRITDVILARVHEYNEGMKREDVLGLLVEEVLKP